RGSLGLDLATAVNTTLLDNKPQKIPTSIKGPLTINNEPHGALLLGQSSSGLKGLLVLPGVIDADYCGLISIVVQTYFPPMHIPAGSVIAQLVPMVQLTKAMKPTTAKERGTGGFGSTGSLTLLTLSMKECPVVEAVFQHNNDTLHRRVLLDPGSDLTITC
ncbi:POK9 protein, partial [Aleadryas rufinucha]|nr:POK9 protein [Aleadryas rufinucha]